MGERLYEPNEIVELRSKLAAVNAPSAEAVESGVTPPAFEPPVRTANTSWEPSPTGSGSEDLEARGYDDGYRHGRSDAAHAQPRAEDGQALAGELADAAEFFREKVEHYVTELEGSEYGYLAARGALSDRHSRARAALARDHAAIGQHGGEPHG